MKKIYSLLAGLSLFASLTLSSCGSDSQNSESSGPFSPSSQDSFDQGSESSSFLSSSEQDSFSQSSSSEELRFTIVWANYDGTVLETDVVSSGETPTYDGAVPKKEGGLQYSYSFSGWSPEVSPAYSDQTYTAQFNETTNSYSVTWKNYDGSILKTDTCLYGTLPIYNGAIPTKPSDERYTYYFSGWSPEVKPVDGDAFYTAQFSETLNTFTVTWKNYDGTVLETDTDVPYGSIPSYDGVTPTKEKNAQYSYRFSGWDKDLVTVTSDITYTAVYNDVVNTYTVTWKNWDGEILEADSDVPYGSTPSYDGATPSKPSDAQYSYAFSGWSPEISSVTGDAVYVAEFVNNTQCYTITWKNYDGSVLETDLSVPYGSMPSFDSPTPTKASNAQYSYTFSGWSPEVEEVKGDATYVACFNSDINGYTVRWENYDGTLLELDSDVPYGSMPTYDGAAPVKKSSAQYSYTFSGWSPNVTTVTGDVTYQAKFSSSVNGYTITWVNDDGTVLEKDYNVLYGNTPSYDGVTPTKAKTAQFTYEFSGWSPEIKAVEGDATYIARYSSSVNSYTVTWQNYDGTVLETDEDLDYGTYPTYDGAAPTKAGNDQYSYAFSGWSPSVSSVKGDVTYKATFSESVNTYVVEFKNYDGTTLYSVEVPYGSSATYSGSTPTRGEENHKRYAFTGWSGDTSKVVANMSVSAVYKVYDVYDFTFIDGSKTAVAVSEGEDIASSMPKNSETVSTADTETSYLWTSDGDYAYKEISLSRKFYSVTYNLNGGTNSLSNSTKVYADETYALYQASKKGYVFDGWYTDEAFTNKAESIANPTENVTLYAKFSLQSYSIIYHLDGATNATKNPDSYTIEDEITLKDPSKTGYTFNGWYTDAKLSKSISTISASTGSIDLYPKFTANVYNATFVSYPDRKITVKLHATVDSILNAADTDDVAKKVILSVGESFDPYTIDMDGKVLDYSNVENVKTTLKGATRNLIFKGWYMKNSAGEMELLGQGRRSYSTDVDLWPVYTGLDLSYGDSTEGLADHIEGVVPTYKEAKSIKYLNYLDTNKAYLVPSGVCRVEFSMESTHDVKLGNICILPAISVRRGGSEIYRKSNASINARIDSSGYYYYASDFVLSVEPGDLIYAETGYRNYSFKSLRFGYSSSDIKYWHISPNSGETSCSVSYDSQPSCLQETPTLEGYDFGGWIDESGNVAEETWKYDSNQTFKGAWTPKNYSIEYETYGGTNPSTNYQSYTIEDSFTLNDPIKPGYTFCGWYLDSDFSTKISSIKKRTGNLRLYAKWTPKTYQCELDANDGSFTPKVQFVSDGSVIRTEYLGEDDSIASYYPEPQTGRIFAGWYTDSEFKNVFDFNATITEDTVLYARWIDSSCGYINLDSSLSESVTISGKAEQYIAFTPLVSGNITVTSSSSMDLVGSLLDESKNSLVTADDISDDELDFSFAYEVEAGKTYYIAVKGNTASTNGEATLNIAFDGVSSIKGTTYTEKTISVTYGDSFYLPDYAEREGYTFLGWYDDNGVKYEGGQWYYTANLSLHAEWVANA